MKFAKKFISLSF